MSGRELDADGTDSYHENHPWEQAGHPSYLPPAQRTKRNWPPVPATPVGAAEQSRWDQLPNGAEPKTFSRTDYTNPIIHTDPDYNGTYLEASVLRSTMWPTPRLRISINHENWRGKEPVGLYFDATPEQIAEIVESLAALLPEESRPPGPGWMAPGWVDPANAVPITIETDEPLPHVINRVRSEHKILATVVMESWSPLTHHHACLQCLQPVYWKASEIEGSRDDGSWVHQ